MNSHFKKFTFNLIKCCCPPPHKSNELVGLLTNCTISAAFHSKSVSPSRSSFTCEDLASHCQCVWVTDFRRLNKGSPINISTHMDSAKSNGFWYKADGIKGTLRNSILCGNFKQQSNYGTWERAF